MRRKKSPLERAEGMDPAAKAKVAAVLQVLAGEKTIREVCAETGMNSLHYYKLEDKMIAAMLHAARIPDGSRRRRDPLEEAGVLAARTQELREEHRRLQSLLRVSRKVFRAAPPKRRPGRPHRRAEARTVRPAKAAPTPTPADPRQE